jgi:hypothetical protein
MCMMHVHVVIVLSLLLNDGRDGFMVTQVAIVPKGQIAGTPDATEETADVNFTGVVIDVFVSFGSGSGAGIGVNVVASV